MIVLLMILVALFGSLSAFLWLGDHAGKITLNGISFREREWDRWLYGSDSVLFSEGRVTAISNVSGTIKFSDKFTPSQSQ